MSCSTGRLLRIDRPQSPCTSPASQMLYCTRSGFSKAVLRADSHGVFFRVLIAQKGHDRITGNRSPHDEYNERDRPDRRHDLDQPREDVNAQGYRSSQTFWYRTLNSAW